MASYFTVTYNIFEVAYVFVTGPHHKVLDVCNLVAAVCTPNKCRWLKQKGCKVYMPM